MKNNENFPNEAWIFQMKLTAGVVGGKYVTGIGLRVVVVVVIGSDFSVAWVGGIYVG